MNLSSLRGIGRMGLLLCLSAALVAPLASAKSSKPRDPDDITVPTNWSPPKSLRETGYYNLGPTGMIGYIIGGMKGHQILVIKVDNGSPAHGHIKVGDVIIGVNGNEFVRGENKIVIFGNAIDEAEKNENGGRLTFTVWHDRNHAKRNTDIDMGAISVDELFEKIADDKSGALEEWKTDKQRATSQRGEWREKFEKFPIDSVTREITLTLQVMGSYSDTSPWDCPKVAKIRVQGWKILESNLRKRNNVGRFKVRGLALLASGRPEHAEMVRRAVHASPSFMGEKKIGKDGWGWHYGSWHAGYTLVFLGEYYLRTGDKAILPGLRKWAVATAKLQTGGGTWGHSAARRQGNFGRLGGPAPGYGAMNQAGGVCFFGLTLAQKAGINEPLVDLAIERAIKFNSTFVDKGCVPYGYHPPAGHEDSNGKNGPPALAFRMVGELYKAKYFAQNSNAASCWGYRAGHGNGTFGNYWPHLAANLCGKEGVIHWMKKMRPYYTMLRRHDGSFVSVSSGNNGGIGCLFDPTGIYLLHYSAPMRQLYVTGRDPLPELQHSADDLVNLADQARSPSTVKDLSTREIFGKLNTFSAKRRRQFYAPELARRYLNGDDGLLHRLKGLLRSPKARERDAAMYAIAKCGLEELKSILPELERLQTDPVEFVRVTAVKTTGKALTIPDSKKGRRGMYSAELGETLSPLLRASMTTFDNETTDIANTANALSGVLLNTDNAFARDPYACSIDEKRVTKVLERFFNMDPRQNLMQGPSKFWGEDTVVKMAGPIVFVAETYPLNGVMFGGAPVRGGQSLLNKYRYKEQFEASCGGMIRIANQPRDIRPRLDNGSMGWFNADHLMKYRGGYKKMLPYLRKMMVEHPNLSQSYRRGETKLSLSFHDAIRMVETDKRDIEYVSLRKKVEEQLFDEIDMLPTQYEQASRWREELAPKRKSYFKQMAAMTRLVELLGSEAVADLGPYIRHDVWRMRELARKLITDLDDRNTGRALVVLAGNVDELIAGGAFEMLALRGDRVGLRPARIAVTNHSSAVVRGAAAMAVYGCSRGRDLMRIMTSMRGAGSAEELRGYEAALLMSKADARSAEEAGSAIRKLLRGYPLVVRKSLYHVLGQLGGEDNLRFLKRSVDVEDETEFAAVIDGLARSRDIAATGVLGDILTAHQGTERAHVISKLSFKRMVNGGEVLGHVPDDVNLDFAETHLRVVRSLPLIKYLGNISTVRCQKLLFRYMKKGPSRVTSETAKSIVASAERMSTELPMEERRASSEVLAQVIEYVNVVHTMGGALAHTRKGDDYAGWKIIADRAGAALRRIYSPEEDDVGDFDEEDLDI